MIQKLLAWLGGTATTKDLSPFEALGRQGTGSVILDVREQHEWASGHVKGAIHIPLGRLGTQVGRLARDAEIIAVCTSGGRSSRAVSILRDAGARRPSGLEVDLRIPACDPSLPEIHVQKSLETE